MDPTPKATTAHRGLCPRALPHGDNEEKSRRASALCFPFPSQLWALPLKILIPVPWQQQDGSPVGQGLWSPTEEPESRQQACAHVRM